MSQPKRTNSDGTYTPLATMNKSEWEAISREPMSAWASRVGRRQVTVNSQPRIVVRGRQQKRVATKGA